MMQLQSIPGGTASLEFTATRRRGKEKKGRPVGGGGEKEPMEKQWYRKWNERTEDVHIFPTSQETHSPLFGTLSERRHHIDIKTVQINNSLFSPAPERESGILGKLYFHWTGVCKSTFEPRQIRFHFISGARFALQWYEGRWFNPGPAATAWQSVLEQDTEPYNSSCIFGPW